MCSVGLWLKDCQGNTFLTSNLNSTYYGIVLDGFSWGNVFNALTNTDSDARGAVLAPQSKMDKHEGYGNVCRFVTKQPSIQGPLFAVPTFSTVKVADQYPLDLRSIEIRHEIETV